ncbi:hypothetical protein DPEC_G00003240 [Dallia pectoralis]|uniref:Uncharacterized protein n=1 Tax=Dallia pectoralis TaxID=75939 RepID=A0ACC2HK02_DALPE|nr:hypothetical protein DPEC_G00003240 [Dallia pectoralis]
MCVNGPVLRILLLVLLLGVSYCERKCNYSEILVSYRKIIYVELQHLNLTSSFNTSNERDRCIAGKKQGILHSIHGLVHKFLCHKRDEGRCQRNDAQEGMLRTVCMMKHLIIRNCNPSTLQNMHVKTSNWCPKRKKKKIELMRALKTCWQKLQSVFIPTK